MQNLFIYGHSLKSGIKRLEYKYLQFNQVGDEIKKMRSEQKKISQLLYCREQKGAFS